ncbi:unnamed protein product [Closterium sp. Yama58-4]|nr:unnamed protein product [Closterium sp. Yama58-4]
MNRVPDLVLSTVPSRLGRNVAGQASRPSWLKSRLLSVTVLPVALLPLLLVMILPLCASSASAEPVRGGLLQRVGHEAAADRGTVRGGSVEEGRAGGERRGLQQEPGGNSTGSNSGGGISGTGNATVSPQIVPPGSGNETTAGNATAIGNFTGSGNFTGAAGNGTEGGAVRYFTVGQEAFVWGSPLVTFFRQQATRAALNAFSYANTTAVVGTTSELLSPLDASVSFANITAVVGTTSEPCMLLCPSNDAEDDAHPSQRYNPPLSSRSSPLQTTQRWLSPMWTRCMEEAEALPHPPLLAPFPLPPHQPTQRWLSPMWTRSVALPNVDTVYGGAFLYLRDQPMVFKTPNMGQSRYYSIGFFQTYGPAFSVNGSRANGPGPNTFTLVGPNWAGELPPDLAPTVIQSPTDDVLLLMRVVVSENVFNDLAAVLHLSALLLSFPFPSLPQSPTNDALLLMRVVVSENVSNDLATVLDLYSQVSLQSLSEALGGPAVAPLPNPPLPSSNLSEALQRMTLIGEGLQRDPPVNNSANNRVVRMVRWAVHALASINVTQQYGFDPYSVTQQQAAALEAARQTTDTLIRAANVVIQINDSLIQGENFWAASTTLLGHDFNTEFLYRATLTAPGGIGGLPPTEVVYFLTFLAEVTPSVAALQPSATNASNTTARPTTPPSMPPSFAANATASPNATTPPGIPVSPPSPPSNITAASNTTVPPINPIDPPISTTSHSSSTGNNIHAENTTTTDSSDTTATTNTTGTQPSPQPPSLLSLAANSTTSMQPQLPSIFPSSLPSPRRPFTPLQGSRCFRLRLTPPPVDSFWSVTVYNASNLNLLEGVTKFGVGDRTPGLLYNPDGTVTIYIQSTSPGQSLEANWIPTVNSTNSAAVVRAYGPAPQILNGTYEPEAIQLSPTCEAL